jgi:hypothetical protein
LPVQLAHVARDRAFNAGAEAPTEHLRQVRMEKRHHWNVACACDVGRAPGRMKRIAGLDQIGFERMQHARPGAREERQAVVEGERQPHAGYGADVAGAKARATAGHQDRMVVSTVGRQPCVLGGEITLHPAAGG